VFVPGKPFQPSLSVIDTAKKSFITSILGQRILSLGGGYNPPTTAIEEFVLCLNVWRSVGPKLLSHRRHFAALAVPAKMFQDIEGGCEGVWPVDKFLELILLIFVIFKCFFN
jgi:hypothetical protein